MNYYKKTVLVLVTCLMSLSHASYEAHEWGTFTSLVGSDGVTQDGMYHEDEPLPKFVHPFGELRKETAGLNLLADSDDDEDDCQSKICFGASVLENNQITQKMETPVIYFYSDKELKVEVNVKFPEGVVTDTYPGPVKTYPDQQNLSTIANGDTTFALNILNKKSAPLPHVEASNIYSHARKVNSNIVSSGSEVEKFLFYRGIGRFTPHLGISSSQGRLSLSAKNNYKPQAAFLVHVNQSGHGRMLQLNNFESALSQTISATTIKQLSNHKLKASGKILTGASAKSALTTELEKAGLNPDEALSMVNTWEHGYLKVPGLRLLYILPNNEVDEILPISFTPAPQKLVRAFVGRIEILLDTEEQRIINEIKAQGPYFRVHTLGRFAEPILRRIAQVVKAQANKNPGLENEIERLIKKAAKLDTSTSSVQ